MPLRDHFRPPVSSRHSWEGFHAQWPAMLVQRLFPDLPCRLHGRTTGSPWSVL